MTLSLFTAEPAPDASVQRAEILDKVPVGTALSAAAPFISAIRPICSQIVVAGSARRGLSHVGDLEYVAVERHEGAIRQTLFQYCFEHKIRPETFFGQNKNGKKQIKCHLQADGQDLLLELYITQPKQFGWIHFIRTGHLKWNIAAMLQLTRNGFTMQDGLIHNGSRIIDCSEETTIFKLLGIPFLKPKFRTGDKALYHQLIEAGQKPAFKPK